MSLGRSLLSFSQHWIGIIFSWVSLAPQAPESKIGAGTLGIIGGVVGLAVGGIWVAIACAAAGTFYGGLVGNKDLKHPDGSHDDGIAEEKFLLRSRAGTELLISICRRSHVGDAHSLAFWS